MKSSENQMFDIRSEIWRRSLIVTFWLPWQWNSELYLGSSQISMIELFMKVVNGLKFYKRSMTGSLIHLSQLTFTCSKSTLETLEKGVKYVQNCKKIHRNGVSPILHFYTPWKLQKTFGFLTFSGEYRNWALDWRRSGVFIVNFEHISHLFLLFLLLTLNK